MNNNIDLNKLAAIADRVEARGLFNAACDIRDWIQEVHAAQARSGSAAPAAAQDESSDPVVEANRKLLLDRSRVGINKYGVTLAASGLSRAQLAQHALEEALDLANYLQTIIQTEAAATPEQSDTTKGQA